MTAEELDDIHTAYWAGINVAREGGNLVLAYRDLLFVLMEKRETVIELEDDK